MLESVLSGRTKNCQSELLGKKIGKLKEVKISFGKPEEKILSNRRAEYFPQNVTKKTRQFEV